MADLDVDFELVRRRHAEVRARTRALAQPLSEADAQVQSMPDASPAKWHLAHTTWFFETLVLEAHEPGFRAHHPAFRVLYNSYYQAVGPQHPRPQRGLVTRPSLAEVLDYREAVDARIQRLLSAGPTAEALGLVVLGLQHEQQHQELLLTDLLHLFSCNPMAPAYRAASGTAGSSEEAQRPDGMAAGWAPAATVPAPVRTPPQASPHLGWVDFPGGLVDIGHAGPGFAFDNETPRHRRFLAPYALADRLVTQGEWLEFIADGGYRSPRWWMSAGWDWLRAEAATAPLHWWREPALSIGTAGTEGVEGTEGSPHGWRRFGLDGLQPLDPAAPVAHLSWYEAEAYARWHAAQHPSQPASRLPTEAEWEHAAESLGPDALDAAVRQEGAFLDSGALAPQPLRPWPEAAPGGQPSGLRQMFGQVWVWTRSAYEPYDGYRPWRGAVGEYNGKFMAGQFVLRGGSCFTPRSHLRTSYRNFFPAAARWQVTGLRLARDAA